MRGYLVPAGEAEAELRERGSRFLAVVREARDESSAARRIDELRAAYADATHHCWAFRLGEPARERVGDDGEPAGTAGRPMLQVLRGAELSDVVAVVVRWFGGTQLGKGGLARAYAGAVRDALQSLPTARRVPSVAVDLVVAYDRLGAVRRLVHPPEVIVDSEEYGALVRLRLVVHRDRLGALSAALADLGVTLDASGLEDSAQAPE